MGKILGEVMRVVVRHIKTVLILQKILGKISH